MLGQLIGNDKDRFNPSCHPDLGRPCPRKWVLRAMRAFIVLLLCLPHLSYSFSNPDSLAAGVDGNAATDYGPKLPEGEDGQANVDAGKKIQMLYWVGLIGLGVLALVTLLNQLEASEKD